jgi:WD40 repeat protein
MQAQKTMGKKIPSFAVTAATVTITATALIGGMYLNRTRYPSTDFSQQTLGEESQLSQTLLGRSSWIYTVAIAPDGETVASGSYDGKIEIWHLPTGGLTRTIEAHPDPIASLAISNDGEILVSGSWDDCIKVWNLKTGNLTHTINTFADDVKAVALSPDGETIVAGTYSGLIQLWSSKTGEQTGQFRHTGPVASVAVSPDGK